MIDALDAAAQQSERDAVATLDKYPWLGAAIDADATAGRFAEWGASTVVDENIGAAVISRTVFDALHDRAQLQAQWPVGNAGVLHVYGYLLSRAETPYGLKRARWMNGHLAIACGLPADAFVPWASPRTLLERVGEAAHSALSRAACIREAGGATLALERTSQSEEWALVYAVDGLLVTTFPVVSVEQILAEWDADPQRLRWNAVR
ncbi:amino acid deaminase [Microbacterium sp. NPDC076911]|uniref:amino acid deaminase n=1 Tax=Microbacterium sp. NPDC076911 TaxID=3154958 RepID=UPI00343E9CE5